MDKTKSFFILAFGTIASLLGNLTVPVLLMVICNIIDYVTGIMAAPRRGKKISSTVGLRGIAKKICMWLLVVVGVIVDVLLEYAAGTVGINLPTNLMIGCIVCIWIVCNELLSILENIADIGVPIPKFLKKIVSLIKDQSEKKADVTSKEGEQND